ncbi:MAG: DUF2318 domain-containing protein [Chitinophagales bacterium]
MSSREQKRQKVMGKGSSGRRNKWLVPALFGLVILAIAGVGLGRKQAPAAPQVQSARTESVSYDADGRIEQIPVSASQAGGVITVPLAEVKEKKLVGFTYQGQGKSLPLLAYIAPSGKVVTAVSMCEPCNSTTFHTEGTQLVCNTCGTRWNLEDLSGVSGGCLSYPPDPFGNTLVDGKIQIQEASVSGWQRRV